MTTHTMQMTPSTHYEPGTRVTLTPKFVRDNGGERFWPVVTGTYVGTTPGGFAVIRFDHACVTIWVAFENLMRETA